MNSNQCELKVDLENNETNSEKNSTIASEIVKTKLAIQWKPLKWDMRTRQRLIDTHISAPLPGQLYY